jgi:uncharacterized protein (TIGR03118 family)
MNRPSGRLLIASAFLLIPFSVSPLCPARGADSSRYVQHNLVSDDTSKIPADNEDTTLLNPWGVAFFPSQPFWINDNGSGISALYNGDGTGFMGANPALAVTVPTPSGTGTSAPTGIVANTSFAFPEKDNDQPAIFTFATEDGTISAWNLEDGFPTSPPTHSAELEIDNSAKGCTNGSVYKGLAMGSNATGEFLYATNFRCATVDVFGPGTFSQTKLSGSFQDPNIPTGFAPFGIANRHGNLVVTYALQDAAQHDDVAGKGNGFVDIYDTNGNLIRRFATRGTLNSPWGIAEAPSNFGTFSDDLLIGNFGDGRINAFKSGGQFQGQLKDPSSKTIAIDGLWSIIFGGAAKSDPGILYFTAGPNDEADGLFGTLTPE